MSNIETPHWHRKRDNESRYYEKGLHPEPSKRTTFSKNPRHRKHFIATCEVEVTYWECCKPSKAFYGVDLAHSEGPKILCLSPYGAQRGLLDTRMIWAKLSSSIIPNLVVPLYTNWGRLAGATLELDCEEHLNFCELSAHYGWLCGDAVTFL